jgi:rare lipoprotein A (peptidoglycan hydrolase)
MTTRTRRAALVSLACAIVLLGGCASRAPREGEQAAALPPPAPAPPAPAPDRARTDGVARKVETKAKRTEKAEGKQNLVKDRVQTKTDASGKPVVEQTGEASWYGKRFHGKKTASGERFDQHAPTAAHPTLPLGTKATVTNLETGKSADVTITDRGPYAKGRDIDLSKGAADEIGVGKAGAAPVKIEAEVSPTPAR